MYNYTHLTRTLVFLWNTAVRWKKQWKRSSKYSMLWHGWWPARDSIVWRESVSDMWWSYSNHNFNSVAERDASRCVVGRLFVWPRSRLCRRALRCRFARNMWCITINEQRRASEHLCIMCAAQRASPVVCSSVDCSIASPILHACGGQLSKYSAS